MSDDFWDLIDPDLNLGEARATERSAVDPFLEAGFTEDEARRGASMMSSGRYFGFVDVATSLRPAGSFGRVGMTPVMESAVERVGRRLEEDAAALAAVVKDAHLQESATGGWEQAGGKPMTEAQIRQLVEKHGQRLRSDGGRRMLQQLAEAAGPAATRLVATFLGQAVTA